MECWTSTYGETLSLYKKAKRKEEEGGKIEYIQLPNLYIHFHVYIPILNDMNFEEI